MSDLNNLISIVVPIYNVEKYLVKALDSIVNQTYRNIEIVLVNDGSTDKSSEICKEYASADDRIKLYTKENGGLISAWLYGLNMATGKYVGFVDSDDYIELNMFELLYESLAKNNSDIAICNVYIEKNGCIAAQKDFLSEGFYTGNDSEQLKMKLFPTESNDKNILMFYRVNKLFIRDKLVDSTSYLDMRVSKLEDMTITFPYILACENISVVNLPLYYYVYRDGSILNFSNVNDQIISVERALAVAQKVAEDYKYDCFRFDKVIEMEILSALRCYGSMKSSIERYNLYYDLYSRHNIEFNNLNNSKLAVIKKSLFAKKRFRTLYSLLKIKNGNNT